MPPTTSAEGLWNSEMFSCGVFAEAKAGLCLIARSFKRAKMNTMKTCIAMLGIAALLCGCHSENKNTGGSKSEGEFNNQGGTDMSQTNSSSYQSPGSANQGSSSVNGSDTNSAAPSNP